MAVPSPLGQSGIVREGMRRALGRAPISGEVVRGHDIWFPELLNEIWGLKPGEATHRLIEQTAVIRLTEGSQRFDLPVDFAEPISLTVLDGTARDTMQSATSTTATLVSTDTTDSTSRIGRRLVTLSGTGAGQLRTILGWTAPQVTSMDSPWTTTPNSTTTYLVADTDVRLTPLGADELERYSDTTFRDRPAKYRLIASTFDVFPVPDKIYPLLLRYWVNMVRLDLASAAYQRLLTDWQAVHIQGIYVKTLLDEQDTLYESQYRIYRDMIAALKTTRSGLLESHET